MGHIDLPVPVYNPLFFSQMYTLLRGTCVFCNCFKLSQLSVHVYECKLRLIQHGLIPEISELEGLLAKESTTKSTAEANNIDSQSTLYGDIKRIRNEFVERVIAKAILEGRSTPNGINTSVVQEERKQLIRQFYQEIVLKSTCANCHMICPKFRKDGYSKIFELGLSEKDFKANSSKAMTRTRTVFQREPRKGVQSTASTKNQTRYILSSEVLELLNSLFRNENSMCTVLFHSRPNDKEKVSGEMFFMKKLVVPPTRFRLPTKVGDQVHTNPKNDLLAGIITTSLRIRDLNQRMALLKSDGTDSQDRKQIFSQLMNSLVTIQNEVNSFLDSTKSQSRGTKVLPGVKQTLEKKEGLFRKNMMGKRVNYAARSVISPDPNIETNEIGIPPVFAVNLTYPEPVTSYNFQEMRQAVINGPDLWPGATAIEDESGQLIKLANMSVEERTALANQLLTPSLKRSVINKKVYRHIRNQDVVLMNRQPTLHKASMMGHKVRVLPGEKTLRLHYANTGAYNADFDGDEMNMHFPQNEAARAEAMMLANTDSQYLTPTSGKPLRGLIQDHISAGVILTSKDTFFTKEKYQQLIYGCIRPEDGHTSGSKIITVPPAVIKPVPLWTGKQVITTALLNITPENAPGLNLKSKNKIKNEYWGNESTENDVIFKNGALICGILDKSQYGAADHGLVHSIHEIYGSHIAGQLLSVLGRLFTRYITSVGFTCGMDDLHLTPEGDSWRKEILRNASDVGRKAAAEVTNLDENITENDPEFIRRLEEILRDDQKLGILDAITQSKVNAVASSIVSKCVPEGTAKRFPVNSMQSMALSGAKGSNVNVSQIMCLLGQQALEGRRVPVMVSGKTLPSFKPFDTQARAGGYIAQRFFSGIRPQEYYFHCMAGREGLIDTAVKTSRSGYLQRCLIKQLEGVQVTYDNTVRDSDGTLIQFIYGGDAVDVVKESHLTNFKFCVDNFDSLVRKHKPSSIDLIETQEAISYAKKAFKHFKRHSDDPHYEFTPKYDPVISLYNPAKYLGSVSDIFQGKLDKFIKENRDLFHGNDNINEKKFRALMQLKYMQSTIDPGESVGIIASESIGEPSTQMTLNTFHFAGHGAANVTLGIPRMREIIMTAAEKIMTPQMTLPVLEYINDDQADIFCKSVGRILLSEVVDKIVVVESSNVGGSGTINRSYNIKFQFYTKEEYENEYDITDFQVLNCVSRPFLDALEDSIKKEFKRFGTTDSSIGQAVPASESAMTYREHSGTNYDADNEDDGAENDTAKLKKTQAVSYDEPDDAELQIMEASETSDDDDSDMEKNDEDSDSDDDENNNDGSSRTLVREEMTQGARARENLIIEHHKHVSHFNFDDKNGQWCEFSLEYPSNAPKILMVSLIEDVCRKTVIREIPHIGRCLRPPPEQHDGKRVLVTEGVNFKAMWEEDSFIDVNGILSNDVSAVLKTYGVEAARNTIVREINNVFKTYAISVNERHLDLIADMMTRNGTYLAFNRFGMSSMTSPFLKMSFETTCSFLTSTVLDSGFDPLDSPSARIVMGKAAKVGTGSFDVFTPLPEA